MNILLVDPAQRDGVPELYENLGIASLAASTRQAGYETGTILTHLEGWSYRRLGREITRRDPDVLGVSLLSYNARRTLHLLRRLKRDGLRSRIVVGGHFPTFNDEILLQEWPELDVVVRGEGDLTLVELLQGWESGDDLGQINGISYREGTEVRLNPARPLQKDLDSLPWPVRDHTQRIIEMGGTLHMVRARGCYANCAFCSIASFYRAQGGPGWRQRGIESVIGEMEELAARFPEVEMKFLDDQFIGPGKKGREETMSFAQALIDRHLFLEEAATFIIVTDADVDRGIAQLQAAEGATWQQYAQRLMLEGISESELRDRIREQLMLEQLVARLFRPEPVAADDVEAYYRAHAEELRTPARYRTHRIHLSLPSSATEAAKRATRGRAERIRRDLVEGRTSTTQIREQLAIDPAVSFRADGIWRADDEHARELAGVVPLLSPGEWSEPVSTPLGFSLIRTVEVEPPQTPELDERLAHDITGLIKASRLEPILEAWLDERRAESDIRTMEDASAGDSDAD